MQHESVVTAAMTMDLYDAVYALWSACEGMGLGEADSREGIGRYLLRNPGMSRVALDNGRVIGAILAGHDGRRGFLHHLAVDRAYRHRGIGHQLLGEALDALRATGIGKCHGLVYRNNLAGLAFWEAAGWRVRDDISLITTDIPQGQSSA